MLWKTCWTGLTAPKSTKQLVNVIFAGRYFQNTGKTRALFKHLFRVQHVKVMTRVTDECSFIFTE